MQETNNWPTRKELNAGSESDVAVWCAEAIDLFSLFQAPNNPPNLC